MVFCHCSWFTAVTGMSVGEIIEALAAVQQARDTAAESSYQDKLDEITYYAQRWKEVS